MEKVFNSSIKIGDIVSIFPKASEVFKEFKIDFCCGGNRPLSAAISEQGLDQEIVLERLHDAYQQAQQQAESIDANWRDAASSDLIDHIVDTHHNYLKRELPELSFYVTKIMQVHGPRHGDVLLKLHKLFHSLKTELEQHLYKEEEILFPSIREYEQKPSPQLLERTLQVMRETENEHEGAGDILKEMRRITHNYEVPSDGCTTYRLTYQKLEALEADLFQHIHLENNILFPRLEQ